MKAERKIKGKKGRRALKVLLCILLVIALIPVGKYIYSVLTIPSLLELEIEGNVHINFEDNTIHVTRIIKDEKGNVTDLSIDRVVDKEEIDVYTSYLKSFWKDVYVNRSKYQGSSIHLPWIIEGNQPRYWFITVTDEKGNKTTINGLYAYPKDWAEFIFRTNALIGFDYLSDDTQGLPLK